MQKWWHSGNDMIMGKMIVGKVESNTGKMVDDMGKWQMSLRGRFYKEQLEPPKMS